MSEPQNDHRWDPKYRHARVHKDDQGVWQITLCYDLLPLNAFITYEYNVDNFEPVVWDTLPISRDEQQEVSFKVSEAFLHAEITTPEYFADDNHGVYFRAADGLETLLCVAGEWGNPWEIAYALNQAFPQGDTEAFHKEANQRAEERMKSLQQAMGIEPPSK